MNASGALAVGVGAAIGAWLRWWLGIAFNAVLPTLPLGTLLANLVGGYLVGVAVEVFSQQGHLPPELRLLVITGFLGGLTTFSSFSAEAVGLLNTARYGWMAGLILAHVAGSIVMTVLGVLSARVLAG